MEDIKVSKSTVARTVILALALINQVLTTMGHSPIPLSDDQVTQAISLAFTVGASLVAWWKNNSFTSPAKQADEWLREMKTKAKKG